MTNDAHGGVVSMTFTFRTIARIGLALSALVACRVHAQEGSTPRTAIWPENFPKSGLPYSPGILVGNTLYVSGQLGRDPATAQLVPGGLEPQVRQAMANAQKVLRAAGMDFKHVVSVNVFIADFNDFAAFNEIYKTYFPVDPPTRATVQGGLNLGAKIEIQMVAVK